MEHLLFFLAPPHFSLETGASVPVGDTWGIPSA